MFKSYFESPQPFCMIRMSTYKWMMGGTHVSENQNEALGINNLRASYWPHLFSFSVGMFSLMTDGHYRPCGI